MDGTFRVVRAPFRQLFSIHAFVSSGAELKQVPLIFIIMSRRQSADYIEVSSIVILVTYIFSARMITPIMMKDSTLCNPGFGFQVLGVIKRMLPLLTVESIVADFETGEQTC